MEFFDFHPAFKEDGYTILQREGSHKQYLGILANDQSLAKHYAALDQCETTGSIFNFLVENIRLAYQQFHWLEADLISEIEVSPSGQRYLAMRDPNGNIVTVTEMSKFKNITSNDDESILLEKSKTN